MKSQDLPHDHHPEWVLKEFSKGSEAFDVQGPKVSRTLERQRHLVNARQPVDYAIPTGLIILAWAGFC